MLVSLTGIGRYTYELAKGFATSPLLEKVRFQFLLGWVDDPQTLIDKYHSNDQAHAGAPSSKLKQWVHSQARSAFWAVSPTVKGIITAPYKDYIYHSPSFVLPHFAGKCVSTVHDMSAFRVPQFHPQFRVRYQEKIFPHLVKKGNLFITDSEFSKRELLDFFPACEGRVISVALGADPVFQVRSKEVLEPILRTYGLQMGSYTLSVGTIEPRKNIERLIDAYASLPLELRMSCPLVLVGGQGWNSEQIHQKMARYSAEGWLKYLSFVPDQDLAPIYSGAKLFACISHYEGFGLPVLEAMSSGVPVICSNVASLPEVGGDAVLYVDPQRTEQVRDALAQLISDDAQCAHLAQLGLERAKSFSWGRAVEQTIKAYEHIV